MVNLVGIDTPLGKKNSKFFQNFFKNFLKMVLMYTKNVKKIFVQFLLYFYKFEVNILISAEKDLKIFQTILKITIFWSKF